MQNLVRITQNTQKSNENYGKYAHLCKVLLELHKIRKYPVKITKNTQNFEKTTQNTQNPVKIT